MSRLERLLAMGIVFLLIVKIMTTMKDPNAPPYQGQPGTSSDPLSEYQDPVYGTPQAPSPTGSNAPYQGYDQGSGQSARTSYDWNPGAFSKKGIPSKLAPEAGGRIPDRYNLDDTQTTYVYATMTRVYSRMLEKAKTDCGPLITAQALRWEQRHARTVEDAEIVLDILNITNLPRSTRAFLAMPKAAFRSRACPQVERLLAKGSYTLHPEAIERLAHAARAN